MKMHTKEDVQRLIADVGELKARRHAMWMERSVVPLVPYPAGAEKVKVDDAAVKTAADLEARVLWERASAPVEWEVTRFGLRAEAHDPVTGTFVLAADPPGVFMNAKAVDDALWTGRKPVMDKAAADHKAAADAAKAAADKSASQLASQPVVNLGPTKSATG
jgi:hypothetical protein